MLRLFPGRADAAATVVTPAGVSPGSVDVVSALHPGSDFAAEARADELVSRIGGATIYADGTGMLVGAAGHREPAGTGVIAVRFTPLPDFVFLLPSSDETDAIRMDHDALNAGVLSYRIVSAVQDGMFFLRHPNRQFFVCAAPGAPGVPIDVSCNREGPGGWEEFHFGSDRKDTLSERARAWIAAIGRALAGGADGDGFCRWLVAENDGVLAACGQAVLRTLGTEALATVGFRAATETKVGERLRLILPDDPWISTALLNLGRWLHARKLEKTVTIDTTLDFLGHDYAYWRGTWSITSMVTTLARTKVEPRHRLAVLATARNEGVYFLQWIAHYRVLGAEHFFLYSNDNNDGSDALLAALAENGEITWTDNHFGPKVDGQLKAYSHCLSFAPQILDYKWTLIVDLDEFVIVDPARHASLPDLLETRRAGGATVVALSWLMFAMGGNLGWERRPLLERCVQRETSDNSAVKSAFLTRNFIGSYPHDPIPAVDLPAVYHDAAGQPHHWEGRNQPPSNGKPLYEVAWVNHYFFKSVDEYLWKTSRNRGGFELTREQRVRPDAMKALAHIELANPAMTTTRGQWHLRAVEREIERLMALPGVAEAQARVEENFAMTVERLREQALATSREEGMFEAAAARRIGELLEAARDLASAEHHHA